MSDSRPRRRQMRGERRIEQALVAAAAVFAEVGYQAATTNAIAARAGMSPGSLYQFFPNKEAIAEALAQRYISQLQLAQDAAFSPDLAQMPLDKLLDNVLNPLISFNVGNPGFQALFADSSIPSRLTRSPQQLHDAVLRRVEALIAARAPNVPPEKRTLYAEVSVHVFRALLPTIVSTSAGERDAMIGELKTVLRAYLEPVIGDGRERGHHARVS